MGEAVLGVGQALAERELPQARMQQWLERMSQRTAEQLDGLAVDQFAQQWARAVTPQRLEVLDRLRGLGKLANPELAQGF